MKEKLPPWIERGRIEGEVGAKNGVFRLAGPEGNTVMCIVSDGSDWKECGLPEPVWEHVSVSRKRHTPSWREMEYVRNSFFSDEEIVLQLSVPRAMHINAHDHCLHLWRPVGVEIPLPPAVCV